MNRYAIVSPGFRGPVCKSVELAQFRYRMSWLRRYGCLPNTRTWLVAGESSRAVSLAVPWICRSDGHWWSVLPCDGCGKEILDGPFERCHPCRVAERLEKERQMRLEDCRIGRHRFGQVRFIRNISGMFTGMSQECEHTCKECGRTERIYYPGWRRT